MRRLLLLALLAPLASPAGLRAQAPAPTAGTCAAATAEAYLEGRDVRARILGDGALFWRGDPVGYEVPKGAGATPMFSTTLWVGGLVGNDARVAASTYGPWEFWPGPLPADGSAPVDCAPYDRLWRVTREEVEVSARAGAPMPAVRDWPAHLGAPVLDGDGDPLTYAPAAGDRPALLGDAAVWWVMNDRGGAHAASESDPLGLEVRAMAFAFDEPGVLGRTTFYRYRLAYHGPEPLDRAWIGLHMDPDLGNFDDDYVGADTLLELGYVYNADDHDEGHYGDAPPAFGVAVLQGPQALADGWDNDRDGARDEPGERHGMTSFVFYYGGGGIEGDPQEPMDYLHYMSGQWKDGRPITHGGSGLGFSTTPAWIFFPGDPVTGDFWSERNLDGRGTPSSPSDRRFVIAAGPFSMQPGETEEVVFALVWSRGADHLDSVRRLREDVAHVHAAREAILTPRVSTTLEPPAPRPVLDFTPPAPNPVRGRATLRYTLPRAAAVRLALYDAAGRRVRVLDAGHRAEGPHEAVLDAAALPPGVYFARLEVAGAAFAHPVVVVR